MNKSYTVQNFLYNGLFVHPKPGKASYTAKFKGWDLHDVGVAICECSDGIERHIPTCQLDGFKISDYPKHETPKEVEEMKLRFGVHMGTGSKS
jgi:hypothetical protein